MAQLQLYAQLQKYQHLIVAISDTKQHSKQQSDATLKDSPFQNLAQIANTCQSKEQQYQQQPPQQDGV